MASSPGIGIRRPLKVCTTGLRGAHYPRGEGSVSAVLPGGLLARFFQAEAVHAFQNGFDDLLVFLVVQAAGAVNERAARLEEGQGG